MAQKIQGGGRYEASWRCQTFTLLSGTTAWQEGAAFLTAAGKVVPAQHAAALYFLGRFTRDVDAAGVAPADKPVEVDLLREVRLFRYANATAGDAIQATDVMKMAYFADDNTVQITPNAKRAGRIWKVDSRGILIEHLSASPVDGSAFVAASNALGAFAGNDLAPAGLSSDAIYDIPATAGASTVTLPAAAADGTSVQFVADGTKNGHTVQYRDATGPVNLTTALVASKRHLVIATKRDGKWFANAYVAP